MSGPAKRLLLCALALFPGAGCKEEPSPENDRTLARLKQEVDRQTAEGVGPQAPGQPRTEGPNDQLAELAARAEKKPPEESGKAVPLPEGNATVHVGRVAVKLLGMRSAQAQSTPKVTLTTEERFLHARVIAQ
ncbi:MAG TPA: hypothetical protein VK447_08105, partial [Myxococcaceae bacterium]|nr:hypothetical protein [Myxococcaceae bacterium]